MSLNTFHPSILLKKQITLGKRAKSLWRTSLLDFFQVAEKQMLASKINFYIWLLMNCSPWKDLFVFKVVGDLIEW